MSEVSVPEHAARLRLLRLIGGMLLHPESHKVLSDERFDKLADAAHAIRNSTPMTDAEFLDFCLAGARDQEVVWRPDRERWVFGLKDDRAQ